MRIIFLGTGGGRFVVFKQIRATGGMWLQVDDKNILIDPGPGSLLRILRSKRKLKPENIDFIFLTHRHLDHSADINTIIEARTEGGFKKGSIVYLPRDAINNDPIVFNYLRAFVEKLDLLEEGKRYFINENCFVVTPLRLKHTVETYGFNFIYGKKKVLSIISDTEFFSELGNYYNGENVILNVVLFKKRELTHFSFEDIVSFLNLHRPKRLIITHFGMGMIKKKPWKLAEELSRKTGIEIIAARDGMEVDLNG